MVEYFGFFETEAQGAFGGKLGKEANVEKAD